MNLFSNKKQFNVNQIYPKNINSSAKQESRKILEDTCLKENSIETSSLLLALKFKFNTDGVLRKTREGAVQLKGS